MFIFLRRTDEWQNRKSGHRLISSSEDSKVLVFIIIQMASPNTRVFWSHLVFSVGPTQVREGNY